MRIGGDKFSLRAYIFHNIIDRIIVTRLILIKDMSMPVTESASFNVLTREPYMESFLDECCKSKGLSCTPINVLSSLNICWPLIKYFPNESMEFSIFWEYSNFLTYFLELVLCHTSHWCHFLIKLLDLLPFFRHPVFELIGVSFAFNISFQHLIPDFLFHPRYLIFIRNTFIQKLLFIYSSNWIHLSNSFIH